jgi:type II secretory pathway pseudopilin PulG
MVVLVIIGVLVVMAIGQYSTSRTTALNREASVNLASVFSAEKNYKMENGTYVNGTDSAGINAVLNIALPDPSISKWAYKVDSASATAFTARASLIPASGGSVALCVNESVNTAYSCTW